MNKYLLSALAAIALIIIGSPTALHAQAKDKNAESPLGLLTPEGALMHASYAAGELPGYVAVIVSQNKGYVITTTTYVKRLSSGYQLFREERAVTPPGGKKEPVEVHIKTPKGTWLVQEGRAKSIKYNFSRVGARGTNMIGPRLGLDAEIGSEVSYEGEADCNGMRCLKLRRTLPDYVITAVRLKSEGKDHASAPVPITSDKRLQDKIKRAQNAIGRLTPEDAENLGVANEFFVDKKSGVIVAVRVLWGNGKTATLEEYKTFTVDTNLSDKLFEVPGQGK